jgi:hypothetical protein
MQWRHAGEFKQDRLKLADYAFFSVYPRVWYNRGIQIGSSPSHGKIVIEINI